MDEFDLIRRHLLRSGRPEPGVALGIGDDAALLEPPPGQRLAMTMDTMIAGRHFMPRARAEDVGYKVLAVNLSDLAAMGAEPRWIFLSLSMPAADEQWLADFGQGLFALADEYQVALAGGDLVRGSLTVTITACGLVPAGAELRRDGALPGDDIFVTGVLGDAGLALEYLRSRAPTAVQERNAATLNRLHRPRPRIREGLALRGIAHACIDVSDGLGIDLERLLGTSGVGATLDPATLPLSSALRSSLPRERAWDMAIGAGDDYELCFTAPPADRERLTRALHGMGTTVACIGTVEPQPGLRWRCKDGRPFHPSRDGYRHF